MNGGGFSCTIHHLRPSVWPFVWAHCLTGFVIAVGKDVLALRPAGWLLGLVAGGTWAVFLGGPAAALTSVFAATPPETEAQEGRISKPVPGSLGWAALCLMLIGLVGSPAITWGYFDAYLVGIVLIVLHAVPPIRVGRFRSGSFGVQAVGYGALTFYAGYAAAGGTFSLGRATTLTMLAFVLLFLAVRVLLWNESSGLMPWLYAICVMGSFACLGMAEVRLGGGWVSAALAVPPLAGWGILGLARYVGRTQGERIPRLGAVLGIWLITDAAVVLVMLVR